MVGAMKLVQSFTTRAWTGGFKAVVCSNKGCSQWLSERQLTNRRVGVTMNERWYCSYRCFVSTAEERFAQLLTRGYSESNHVSRRPIGLLVLRRGWLSQEQLRIATEEQRQTGNEMGEELVRLGFLSEGQVATVRAAQRGCPVFSVLGTTLPVAVCLPPTLMNRYCMVPVHYVAATKHLLVGFVHAIEYGPLYGVEQVATCKTQPCFITAGDFRTQLQAQAQQATPEELNFDDIQSATEMGRILCSYGVLTKADRVAIARCNEYLWARLKSAGKTVDLLFKTKGGLRPALSLPSWESLGLQG